MKIFATCFFIFILILSGIGHLVNPDFYAPMIPSFINPTFAHILSSVLEFGLVIMLIFPQSRALGGLGFMLLMIAFMPLHIWDFFRPDPMTKHLLGASIRFVLQLLFIYGGWVIWKNPSFR